MTLGPAVGVSKFSGSTAILAVLTASGSFSTHGLEAHATVHS
ncbi:MAG: hypothetical protein ACRC8S_18295 [Fimbriiglobus sp.]